jgi:hypothetical protein
MRLTLQQIRLKAQTSYNWRLLDMHEKKYNEVVGYGERVLDLKGSDADGRTTGWDKAGGGRDAAAFGL